MDSHDLVSDEDGAQTCETENDIVFLPDEEKRQDALFPEMGVSSSIMDNLQSADIIAVLNGGLRADKSEWLMQFRHSLA